jgi:hypothetical protein|tara:strand:- start:284 stop:457 length:174 start_codon:yes stop_codon:yes gene_type:complete
MNIKKLVNKNEFISFDEAIDNEQFKESKEKLSKSGRKRETSKKHNERNQDEGFGDYS